MSPITHLLVGWIALERRQASRRDKTLVVLAGLAPDLDGLGIVVDFATRALGLPETDYYQAFHRIYGHGLAAALVIAAVAAAFGERRGPVFLGAFVAVHLHFLCDLLGSRGSTADDLWGIWYFAPFSLAWPLVWSGQWPLVGWQNMAITAVLIVWAAWRSTGTGQSPLVMASPRADAALVAVFRKWFGAFSAPARGRAPPASAPPPVTASPPAAPSQPAR